MSTTRKRFCTRHKLVKIRMKNPKKPFRTRWKKSKLPERKSKVSLLSLFSKLTPVCFHCWPSERDYKTFCNTRLDFPRRQKCSEWIKTGFLMGLLCRKKQCSCQIPQISLAEGTHKNACFPNWETTEGLCEWLKQCISQLFDLSPPSSSSTCLFLDDCGLCVYDAVCVCITLVVCKPNKSVS